MRVYVVCVMVGEWDLVVFGFCVVGSSVGIGIVND